MKKLISVLLIIALTLSLCACGTVTVGPFDFHFDRVGGGLSERPADSNESSAVAEAPADELATEEPIMEGAFYSDEFSVEPIGIYMGDFSTRGYSAYSSADNPALYLFFVFEYTEYYGDYGSDYINYVPEVMIDGFAYPALDITTHDNHFIKNIDRYFCYEYATPHRALSSGESAQMVVCFEIYEESRAAIYAGMPIEFLLQGTYLQYEGATDIMFLEEILNDVHFDGGSEAALSSAQLLWSLDMSYYLINYIRLSTEVYGDTGAFDSFPAEILILYYSGGFAFSPAVMPDLSGEFILESYGMQGMVPEIILEMYGDEAWSVFFEYRDICLTIADMSMGTGNTEALIELCDYATELYYMMLALFGLTPYEFVIEEV